jgi:hypothetical protein
MKVTMTDTVKAMDSQRCVSRTHLFQFNGTSSEDEPKRIGEQDAFAEGGYVLLVGASYQRSSCVT